jgi:trimeric autotransporter adhesin
MVRVCAFRAILCLCVLGTAAGPAMSQTHQGGIRGTIADAGGVIPSAAVRLTEETTGQERATVSNERGDYVFASVLPGTYALRVEVPGYKVHERRGIAVGTQAFITSDVALEPGDLSEEVRVEARVPAVDTSNASVGTLIDRRKLDTLPTSGRNVFLFSTQTPAVISTGDPQFTRQQDQGNNAIVSLGGGPRRDNSYTLDGVPIVDLVNRAVLIPSLEAVEEMRLQVSAYDAEIGRTSGGVFNVTTRSGSNAWHGSGLYQNRPGWGTSRLFFAEKADLPKADTFYHLYGGSLGGPIVANRTFFWTSTEGYRTESRRNVVLVLPTEAERRGDFSQSGVTIYDPLTTRPDPGNPTQLIRDPFPGNRIPADRLNPVAQAMLPHIPMPIDGKSQTATAGVLDAANQITTKLTHRWSDRLTSSGLYAWYGSTEPEPRFYGRGLYENAADPGDGALVRRTHVLALNTIWIPSNHTTVAMRYGLTRFLDESRSVAFDPASLGFAPAFLSLVPESRFPGIVVSDYGRGSSLLGARADDSARYYSQNAGATLTTLRGQHTLRLGGEFRSTGARFVQPGNSGGFSFTRDFTLGPNPTTPSANTGDAFASFLLGYPANGTISVGEPSDIYLHYWSGFVQDDIRLTPKLTVNAGLRYEYETGLRERSDHLTVGWAADQPFPVQVNGTRPDGTPLALTGGLVYAGVNGAPTHQGDPNPRQFAPRVGVAYALDDRTTIRGGYGLFWGPAQAIGANEGGAGTRGYTQSTNYVATAGNPFVPCPTCSLTNPFPSGIQQPIGNSLGALTGVGGDVSFIDPRSRLPRMDRYSVDVHRELADAWTVGVGYLGARGDHLVVGGANGGSININQLDPRYRSLGAALQESVANPFFGTPLGVGILAGPTVQRGQLLRPYPQFDTVSMSRASVARSRYDALVLTGERRMHRRWAASVNYTWSRLRDSQFQESAGSFGGGSAILDNYDIEREYGLAALDIPHRLNISASVALPFGLTVSAVGAYQSGFPISVPQSPNNSGLFGSNQRPNVVSGVDPQLDGGLDERYDPACGCIGWLDPAAWSQAAPFTFGDAPRADGRARTPMRQVWDLAIEKPHRLNATTLSLRFEVINLFNRPDLRGPNTTFGDATFGQIRDQNGFPRMLQLLARVGW